MVLLEIRVMRKDKQRAARDVAAILNALKDEDDGSVQVRHVSEDIPAHGLRLAYSAG